MSASRWAMPSSTAIKWLGNVSAVDDLALTAKILRTSPPCVRFLTLDGRWVRVADSIEVLLDRLGIVQGPVFDEGGDE